MHRSVLNPNCGHENWGKSDAIPTDQPLVQGVNLQLIALHTITGCLNKAKYEAFDESAIYSRTYYFVRELHLKV
jgi:hypothetical protein